MGVILMDVMLQKPPRFLSFQKRVILIFALTSVIAILLVAISAGGRLGKTLYNEFGERFNP
jgi:hypothetical protein